VKFYLGTHQPHFVEQTDVPLFVSHTRLRTRKTLPKAQGPIAIDSGAFTQLNKGAWHIRTRSPYPFTAIEYAEDVLRYEREIGIEWAAPMDWPCEPSVVAKHGVGVREHQWQTLRNFEQLSYKLGELVIPVLQGWELDDYLRHWEMYDRSPFILRGLEGEPLVGVGSVCRRGQDDEIVRILNALRPLKMHAFGVRSSALARCAHFLASADSMAWSIEGRNTARRPGCEHPRGGKSEANCLRFALDWRARQPAVNRTRLEVECVA